VVAAAASISFQEQNMKITVYQRRATRGQLGAIATPQKEF
jgi:hypothetical protein